MHLINVLFIIIKLKRIQRNESRELEIQLAAFDKKIVEFPFHNFKAINHSFELN